MIRQKLPSSAVVSGETAKYRHGTVCRLSLSLGP